MGKSKNVSGRVSAVPQRTKWTAEEDALLRQYAPDYKHLLTLMPHKTLAALHCRNQRNMNMDRPDREKQKPSVNPAQIRNRERLREKRRIKKTQLSCPRNARGVMIPVANAVARAISRVVQEAKGRDYSKVFAKKTRPRINELARNRRANDPAYRAERNLRSRLADYARTHGFIKGASTEQMLKCSWVEFEARMCAMNPDHADCEYDHVFPMSAYDLNNKTNQLRCMHHTNIQPLTRKENRSKSKRLPTKAMAAKVPREFWPDGITEDMLPDIYPGWRTPLRM
jgi:hypothetical protein